MICRAADSGSIATRRLRSFGRKIAHEDPFRLRTRGSSNAKECLRTRRPISSANARPVQREKVSSHTKTHFLCERQARPARKSVFAHEDPSRLRTRACPASRAKKCLRTRRPISPCERAARPARKSVFAHEDPFRLRTRARPASRAKKCLRTRRPISSANARPVQRPVRDPSAKPG